eukprot:scpid70167/ scgid34169/ 
MTSGCQKEMNDLATANLLDGHSAMRGAHVKRLSEVPSGKGDDAWTPSHVQESSAAYRLVRRLFDERIELAQHGFRLARLEETTPKRRQRGAFKAHADQAAEKEKAGGGSCPLVFMFHGTSTKNHDSILSSGFQEEKFGGATDEGYVGRGVYMTPDPEYSMAFIEASHVHRYHYTNPVHTVGSEVKLFGLVVSPGVCQFVTEMAYGADMPSGIESRCAWVNKSANPVAGKNSRFATELVVANPTRVLPRFVLTLVKVAKEIVWLDPNIDGEENRRYAAQLHGDATAQGHLFATSNETSALRILRRKKDGVRRRAVTAGTGGEHFVRRLREEARLGCEVLVFCGNVAYHGSWAKKFENVRVTSSVSVFKEFARWSA